MKKAQTVKQLRNNSETFFFVRDEYLNLLVIDTSKDLILSHTAGIIKSPSGLVGCGKITLTHYSVSPGMATVSEQQRPSSSGKTSPWLMLNHSFVLQGRQQKFSTTSYVPF